MSRPTTDVTIDQYTYHITALPATEGRRLYLALIKVLAPGLERLPSLKDAKSADKVLALVAGALEGLEPHTLDDFCDTFGKSCEVVRGNQRVTLDPAAFGEHFAGRYTAMTRWLIACVQANKFIDFLSLMPEAPAVVPAGT